MKRSTMRKQEKTLVLLKGALGRLMLTLGAARRAKETRENEKLYISTVYKIIILNKKW